MKSDELNQLVKVAIEQVARNGRDAARVYHAIVKLDRQVHEQSQKIAELEAQLYNVLHDMDYRPDC